MCTDSLVIKVVILQQSQIFVQETPESLHINIFSVIQTGPVCQRFSENKMSIQSEFRLLLKLVLLL